MNLVKLDESERFGGSHNVEYFGDFGVGGGERETIRSGGRRVGLGLAVGSRYCDTGDA